MDPAGGSIRRMKLIVLGLLLLLFCEFENRVNRQVLVRCYPEEFNHTDNVRAYNTGSILSNADADLNPSLNKRPARLF